jgi:pyrimidine-specific ribonucleoside hydrolase
VVDYSPTVSDVTALLYLARHPGVELLGVTLAGTGESHCGAGVSNTLGLLALVGVADVPVACGPEQTVGPGQEWPSDWRDASDELAGLSLPASDGGEREPAVDLLARLAAEAPVPITIVALGPLTNLARALERFPQFADDIAAIYTMGGALDVDGNAPGGEAEWNYYIDPAAVLAVLDSGIAVTMVPLDATNHVPVTEAWFRLLSDHHTTPAATAVFDLHTESRPFESGFYFWDELTASVALDQSLVTLEPRSLSIDIGGGSTGRVREDPDGRVVLVAVDVDRARFETGLLTVLNDGAAPGDRSGTTVFDAATIAYFEAVAASVESLNLGVDRLYAGPEATAFEQLVGDDPAPELDPDQEETARAFLHVFWVGAIDLMRVHRGALDALPVPEALAQQHDSLVAAIDALIASRDDRLADIDSRSGEALLASFWTPSPEIDEFDRSCADLQATATAGGLTLQVCPG